MRITAGEQRESNLFIVFTPWLHYPLQYSRSGADGESVSCSRTLQEERCWCDRSWVLHFVVKASSLHPLLLYRKCKMPIHAVCSQLPSTWRYNDPNCPQGTLKFYLMGYNGVIRTLLKDRLIHLKHHLSDVVANLDGRLFISSSWSASDASRPLKYLEAFKPHWHFHCNTFAIINRAYFFIVINNGVEDSIIEPHIK